MRGQVTKLRCPYADCNGALGDIAAFLAMQGRADLARKQLEFLENIELAKDISHLYCPNPRCSRVLRRAPRQAE